MPKASNAIRVSGPINAAGLEMTLETGKLAPQADGAVLVRVGDTVILSTVVTSKPREGIDFFPLTVDVEERMYAAGKIPGGVFRREGRPGEPAILTCRLTDRPLRPSFPEGFRNEVQVVATIMGADLVNPHDVLSINGASAALTVSGIPFDGPIGAVRLSRQGSDWIAHPTFEQSTESTFELVVAGRMIEGGDIAIMMVEAGGTEATWRLYEEGAPKVTEEVIADGLEEAKQWIKASIELQKKLRTEVVSQRGPIADIPYEIHTDYDADVFDTVAEQATASTKEAMSIADKTERNDRLNEILEGLLLAMVGTADEPEPFAGRAKQIKPAFRALQKKVVRSRIVNEGLRIDGRGTTDIRPLSADVDILPTAHGTGLFQRGETQVLSVLTLGMPRMEQFIGLDELRGTKKRYIHHYNFPPYSTGETGRVGSPKRREIGHGALAERALVPVVPSMEEWPYVLRIVSDVLSSNGSTSMASVCGSTLSMLDGGVPLKASVAGIAMGLVFAEGKYTTLTDILGTEDAFGDMDFKVAGTRDFVTALQLDTKIDGLPADVLREALLQARDARLKILDVMDAEIATHRSDVKPTAPKIVSFEIPMDKIGEVIGPKGKVINTITQETGADVSVSDDGVVGTVSIGSNDGAAVEEARRRIELILDPPTAELGAEYTGKVVNVTKFGAFVNILPGRDGLLHISKLGRGKRIDRVEDVLNLGDEVTVRVDDIDNSGKLSLSLAGDDAEQGDSPGTATPSSSSAPSSNGGGGEGRAPRNESTRDNGGSAGGDVEVASFDEAWDSQARAEFGDLGPAEAGRPGGDRGGERRGGGGRRRGGGGGGGRR
jgi:polyribonucleotide nucleotidyltransferase